MNEKFLASSRSEQQEAVREASSVVTVKNFSFHPPGYTQNQKDDTKNLLCASVTPKIWDSYVTMSEQQVLRKVIQNIALGPLCSTLEVERADGIILMCRDELLCVLQNEGSRGTDKVIRVDCDTFLSEKDQPLSKCATAYLQTAVFLVGSLLFHGL